MTTRAEIVAAARSLKDTPFRHRGRQPGLAMDCAGVLVFCAVAGLFKPAGWDLPAYLADPDGKTMIQWLDEHMDRVPKADMQPGDALVMQVDVHPQHLGILGDYRHGGLSLIHAASNAYPARVIETRLMFHPRQKFVAAYKYRGIV